MQEHKASKIKMNSKNSNVHSYNHKKLNFQIYISLKKIDFNLNYHFKNNNIIFFNWILFLIIKIYKKGKNKIKKFLNK